MNTIMTVAVTGATGFVGRYVVRELLRQGYAVKALARDRAKTRGILPEKARVVVGDVLNQADVDELLQGCQACINLVGIIREVRSPGNTQTFRSLHVKAPRLLVSRCEALGVTRFIEMSALGARDTGVSEYQRTKWEGEQAVRLSELEWTIFRPSLIHGPDGEFVKTAKGWVSGHEAPWVFIPYFTRTVEDKRVPLGPVSQVDPMIQPVAVQDVARAFVAALATPESIGEVYNLVGSEVLSWPRMLTQMRDQLPGGNPTLKPVGLPGEVGAIGAMIAGHLGMGAMLPFDAGMAKMGAEDSTAGLEKFKAHFGFTPAAFSEVFSTYASRV
ncbi:MAG: NAD(P)H-binding protein [Tepidisphaera sp.]|nr:NAD(P)H-binding protein [Tepidisphaera sp.]